MAIGPQKTVLYPVGSRVIAALALAVCLVVESALVSFGNAELALRATPAVLFVAVSAIATLWSPRVELTPAELHIVNPLRSYRVTWPAIRDIQTRWSLTLDTVRGPITAWAAPSPGPFSQLGRVRRDAFSRVSLAGPQEERGNALARSLVIHQWESYREQGMLGEVEGNGVTASWNRTIVVLLLVLFVTAVVCASLP